MLKAPRRRTLTSGKRSVAWRASMLAVFSVGMFVSACAPAPTSGVNGDTPPDGGAGGASSAGTASAGQGGSAILPMCSDVATEAAFGVGIHAEVHCAPQKFSGAAVVSEIREVTSGVLEYRVVFHVAEPFPADCGPTQPSLWIQTSPRSPSLAALSIGRPLHVDVEEAVDLSRRERTLFAVLRDAQSRALLFVRYAGGSAFAVEGTLLVGDEFAFQLADPCEFASSCYEEARRYRLVDAKGGFDLAAFSSGQTIVGVQRFGIYAEAIHELHRHRSDDCPAGDARTGFDVSFAVVGETP